MVRWQLSNLLNKDKALKPGEANSKIQTHYKIIPASNKELKEIDDLFLVMLLISRTPNTTIFLFNLYLSDCAPLIEQLFINYSKECSITTKSFMGSFCLTDK